MSRRSLAPHCLARSPTLAITIYTIWAGRANYPSIMKSLHPPSLATPLSSHFLQSTFFVLFVGGGGGGGGREGGGWRWWRNGQERRGRGLFLSSFPPSLSAHRAAQQEGGREGASSVRPSHPAESSPISPSLHSFSRSVCMIRATCRCRRPSRSLSRSLGG